MGKNRSRRRRNVAVVRLKKNGTRFVITCYKNEVLSWGSEVSASQPSYFTTKLKRMSSRILVSASSQAFYSNVSKGVLVKSRDLIAAFGTDDQAKICLEILDKGEVQVAGKGERESQLSSQFRDIATIVMQKTVIPETQRPYTISMIERLMHEIHFAVEPNTSSKKQTLEVIRELQKHFPIKRSPMRVRLIVPEKHLFSSSTKELETVIQHSEQIRSIIFLLKTYPVNKERAKQVEHQ